MTCHTPEEFLVLTTYLGKPVSHALAKEMLAGFAGAEVDKLAETKGMDEYDRERAKHQVSHLRLTSPSRTRSSQVPG